MTGERRGYLWPLTITLLAVAILVVGLFWLSHSSLLAVETIEVEGNSMLSEEEVLALVGPGLYGQSLLSLSFDDAGDPLREKPIVKDVRVKRDFPNTVRVEVLEYRPVVSYDNGNGSYYSLADDTRVLSVSGEPAEALPLLRTDAACSADVGEDMECDDVRTGIEFVIAVPNNVNQEFNKVVVAEGIIDASTISGIEIHFGTMDEYAYKFEVMRQLIARSMAAGEQVIIDVSVPDRPVIRDKNRLVNEEGAGGQAIDGTDGSGDEETVVEDDEPIIEEGLDMGDGEVRLE